MKKRLSLYICGALLGTLCWGADVQPVSANVAEPSGAIMLAQNTECSEVINLMQQWASKNQSLLEASIRYMPNMLKVAAFKDPDRVIYMCQNASKNAAQVQQFPQLKSIFDDALIYAKKVKNHQITTPPTISEAEMNELKRTFEAMQAEVQTLAKQLEVKLPKALHELSNSDPDATISICSNALQNKALPEPFKSIYINAINYAKQVKAKRG